MKTCSKCNIEKAPREFYPDTRPGRGGLKCWCKSCWGNSERNLKLRKNFGLSREDFEHLVDEHAGRCAICFRQPTGMPGDHLSVDHNHVTGKIRGLLCTSCNLLLGSCKDSVDTLRYAMDYLVMHTHMKPKTKTLKS